MVECVWPALYGRYPGSEPPQLLLATCFTIDGTWVEGLFVAFNGLNLNFWAWFVLVFLVDQMSWAVWMGTTLFTFLYLTPQVKMLDSDWWRAGQHVLCYILLVIILHECFPPNTWPQLNL